MNSKVPSTSYGTKKDNTELDTIRQIHTSTTTKLKRTSTPVQHLTSYGPSTDSFLSSSTSKRIQRTREVTTRSGPMQYRSTLMPSIRTSKLPEIANTDVSHHISSRKQPMYTKMFTSSSISLNTTPESRWSATSYQLGSASTKNLHSLSSLKSTISDHELESLSISKLIKTSTKEMSVVTSLSFTEPTQQLQVISTTNLLKTSNKRSNITSSLESSTDSTKQYQPSNHITNSSTKFTHSMSILLSSVHYSSKLMRTPKKFIDIISSLSPTKSTQELQSISTSKLSRTSTKELDINSSMYQTKSTKPFKSIYTATSLKHSSKQLDNTSSLASTKYTQQNYVISTATLIRTSSKEPGSFSSSDSSIISTKQESYSATKSSTKLTEPSTYLSSSVQYTSKEQIGTSIKDGNIRTTLAASSNSAQIYGRTPVFGSTTASVRHHLTTKSFESSTTFTDYVSSQKSSPILTNEYPLSLFVSGSSTKNTDIAKGVSSSMEFFSIHQFSNSSTNTTLKNFSSSTSIHHKTSVQQWSTPKLTDIINTWSFTTQLSSSKYLRSSSQEIDISTFFKSFHVSTSRYETKTTAKRSSEKFIEKTSIQSTLHPSFKIVNFDSTDQTIVSTISGTGSKSTPKINSTKILGYYTLSPIINQSTRNNGLSIEYLSSSLIPYDDSSTTLLRISSKEAEITSSHLKSIIKTQQEISPPKIILSSLSSSRSFESNSQRVNRYTMSTDQSFIGTRQESTVLSPEDLKKTIASVESIISSINEVQAKITKVLSSRRKRGSFVKVPCSSFVSLVKDFNSVAKDTSLVDHIKKLSDDIRGNSVDTCSSKDVDDLQTLKSSLSVLSSSLTARLKTLQQKLNSMMGTTITTKTFERPSHDISSFLKTYSSDAVSTSKILPLMFTMKRI